eukprot:COSAG05_NODE_5947_length_1053_cov_1.174004_1_plen_280_part_00
MGPLGGSDRIQTTDGATRQDSAHFPQAGGRIHGVFLLGREERVFNLGTPGPSDRTRRTPISRVRFGIANLGTPAPGHVACLHAGAWWWVTKIPGRTTRHRQPSRVGTSASNLREPRRCFVLDPAALRKHPGGAGGFGGGGGGGGSGGKGARKGGKGGNARSSGAGAGTSAAGDTSQWAQTNLNHLKVGGKDLCFGFQRDGRCRSRAGKQSCRFCHDSCGMCGKSGHVAYECHVGCTQCACSLLGGPCRPLGRGQQPPLHRRHCGGPRRQFDSIACSKWN